MLDDLDRKSMPWLSGGFDIEGVAAALAALLVALLLGMFWGPLFWIGFVAFLAVMLAARWSGRTPPDMASAIVAPCDGVVVSIEPASETPQELRLGDAPAVRVRISSAPYTTNKIYTPISGSLETVIVEAGDSSVPLAMRPDDTGLAKAYLTFESRSQQVGVRLSSGGFGPRLDIDMVAGDIARLGRALGTRRLGGWCDVYMPASAGQLIWQGQTLVGGETVMGRLKSEAEPETLDEIVAPTEDAFEPKLDEIEEDDDYPSVEEADMSDDPAVLMARLREAARRSSDE